MTEEMPGRPPPPKNSRFMVRSAENNLPKPRFGGAGSTDGFRHFGRRAVGVDRGAVREHVAGEIGGDHDFRAERARRRYRHRIDQRAVDQPAVADQHRRKNPGQRIGGAHRVDHAAVGQPDLVAGADFGGHGGEFQRQVLDQGRADRGLQLRRQLVAADQARAVETDVEIAEDTARLQAARPFLQRIELPGGIGAADHRADRGADHDIGNDAVGDQGPEDADMGKSARGAAAQRQPDHRPPDAAQPDLVGASEPFWPRPIKLSSTEELLDGASYALSRCSPPDRQHKHGLCRSRIGLGRDCDWTATPRITLGDFGRFRRPSGGQPGPQA